MVTHSSILPWRIPWTGAWRAIIHGVTKNRTQLERGRRREGKGEEEGREGGGAKNMGSQLSQLQPDPTASFGTQVVPHIYEKLKANFCKLLSLFFFAIRYIT